MTIGRIPSVEGGIQPTIVDAKGDILTATAADTPAVLAVGNNGETLVADSSATTGLRWQGNFAAGKNAIINGDMRIWQRGTTFNSIANNSYTADRWTWFYDGTATWNISQQSFTPGTAPVAGYEAPFFLRASLSANTSGTYGNFIQRIEDVRTFAGQTVTISFWAKADSARTSLIYVFQNFGSGGSSTVVVGTPSITYSTSWTRYTFTVSIPSVSGKTIGSSSNLEIGIRTTNTSGSVLDIWGVQVEAGSVATAFQTATGTLAGELAACQRYYVRLGVNYGANPIFGLGSASSATGAYFFTELPVPMRVRPTSMDIQGLQSATAGGGLVSPTGAAIETGISTNKTMCITATGSGYTTGQFIYYRGDSSDDFLGFSAEL